ncbi:MAG: beta-galactosidase [Candidatus Methylacidiphilales bacterium]
MCLIFLIAVAIGCEASEPVEDLGFGKGRVCLNGVWKFQPATGDAEAAPQTASWGSIQVPGNWGKDNNHSLPGIVSKGSGPTWAAFNSNADSLGKAWFERTISIPDQWNGRTILLDLHRVSTDAVVSIDGKEYGRVGWPYGMVDITEVVKPGGTHTLRVLVVAANDRDKVLNMMGVGQNTLVDAKLQSRGLIGEVFLLSRPPGARIDDVWVQTSVRKNELAVQADVVGVTKAGLVTLVATIKDASGAIAKQFEFQGSVAAGDSSINMTFPWADARRWDLGQPNLYTLELQAKGDGLDSGIRQEFGFREAWVEGRTIFLNGTPFRLRPTSTFPEGSFRGKFATSEAIESSIDGILRAGFNCLELWPENTGIRGTYEFRELICDIASRRGLPVQGPLLHMTDVLGSWEKIGWYSPEIRADWERRLRVEWKRYRNQPSVFMWSSSGNIGGHTDDQDPRLMGHHISEPLWEQDKKVEGWWRYTITIIDIVKEVKKMDPRPLMIHQGGPMSDVYAINNYLCMIPLQEREEWLSDWSRHGTMPYCSVEFGTPLSNTMQRGRDGFFFSSTTEWLMTEYCASYLGTESYRLEQADYRREISGKYINGQLWEWPNIDVMNFAPAFQKLQELFITNTWRSWRTMGITAGMLPWGDGHGFRKVNGEVATEPFRPGKRGVWFESFPKANMNAFGEPGSEVSPAGRTLMAVNGPTLAWICGPQLDGDAADFTAKDHSCVAGSGRKIAKRIALLNDSRSERPWRIQVTATLDGKSLGTLEKSGTIRAGETLFVSTEFPLPETMPAEDTNKPGKQGEIAMTATIGNANHTDRFAFRVFPPHSTLPSVGGTVAVFDHTGETSAWLQHIGVNTIPWTGAKLESGDILVIGRKALSSESLGNGGQVIPGYLESIVQQGGRVLLMAQDPQWMRERMGLRVGHLMSRRVFPVDPAHPVFHGLDTEDLRDWTGTSTLLEQRPDFRKAGAKDISRLSNNMPTWGWRWGGRGAVTSAPVEKPHCSGWYPIAECEFDLAYSPLLQLHRGQGSITLCTFDLEDHVKVDPAADRLARNIISWVRSAPPAPRCGPALYVGGDDGAKLLDLVGCEYRRIAASSLDPASQLVIVGPDVSADVAAPVLAAGGKVLVLPKRVAGPAGLGVSVTKRDNFLGSLSPPAWEEAQGLSASDLRWRVEGSALVLGGEGIETGADGMLAKVKRGRGVAIFTQSDPDVVPADLKAYFRLTRWRLTRSLAQVLANLGATFTSDARTLRTGADKISVAGNWKAVWTTKLPPESRGLSDSGPSTAALQRIKSGAAESGMEELELPGRWKRMSEGRGEVVLLRHFTCPDNMVGKEMSLNLGPINGFDTVYINGESIGSTGAGKRNYWTVPRVYRIPGTLLKSGDNVIAVRLFDDHGGGNVGATGKDMTIGLETGNGTVRLYHPDYRTDFILGDDPYRYYRW